MTYSSRFWLYAPLMLFLALAAWTMGHWWMRASELDRTLRGMNGHQAIPGATISWANHTISGFPFQLDVVFNDLLVRAEAPRGTVVWHSDRFALHALTYGRTHDIFEAAGRQTLAWTDADGVRHQLSFLPATLRASAIADNRGLARFDLDMLDASGKDGDGANFTAARVQLHLRRDPKEDALDLALSAEEVKGPSTPFGDHIRTLDLYSRISQGSAFGRLLSGRAGWMDALMAWRQQNGAIVNGPVHVQGSGVSADHMEAGLEARLRALLFPFY